MFGPVGSNQLTRRHWLPLNADMDDMATGVVNSRSQSMARADASEEKISNIFSAIKLTESSTLPPGREMVRQLSMQRLSTIESPTIFLCSSRRL